jgi:hypothetical protein
MNGPLTLAAVHLGFAVSQALTDTMVAEASASAPAMASQAAAQLARVDRPSHDARKDLLAAG